MRALARTRGACVRCARSRVVRVTSARAHEMCGESVGREGGGGVNNHTTTENERAKVRERERERERESMRGGVRVRVGTHRCQV